MQAFRPLLYEPNTNEPDQEETHISIPNASISLEKLYESNMEEFDQENVYTSIPYTSTSSEDHVFDRLNTNEFDQDNTILYDSISLDVQLHESNVNEFDYKNTYTSILYVSISLENHFYEPNIDDFNQDNSYTSIPYTSTSANVYVIVLIVSFYPYFCLFLCEFNIVEFNKKNAYALYTFILSKIHFIDLVSFYHAFQVNLSGPSQPLAKSNKAVYAELFGLLKKVINCQFAK
ncbi:6093_t:CDS:2 [Dentiscutata erythropus]|uniref:6093_t:CDS:1 n=1 Tax=Dentiscutata erythropus TaxID=1348616 RepID=A0A9N9B1E2_9GLOM|nr:6093_t:CDS:2 [Dentiscutata erythropus]